MSNFYPISRQEINFNNLNEYFVKFAKDLFEMNATNKQRDKIVRMCIDLISEVNVCCEKSLNDPDTNKVCEKIHAHASDQLQNIDSKYKRENIMKKSRLYVQPVEMSSGFQFATTIDKNTGEPIQSTFQRTFQYISPFEQLEALFNDQDFEKMYMKFNKSNDHQCK